MGEPGQSHATRWVVAATAVVGLVAGVLLVVSRVYEVRKARAEAERAQLEAERLRDGKDRPPAPPPEMTARPGPNTPTPPAPVRPTPTPVRPTPPPPVAPQPASDLDRLQGKWECVYEQIGGKDFTAEQLAAAMKTMTVAGDTLTIRRFQNGAFGDYTGQVTLRTVGAQKQFDLVGTGPGNGAAELLGVYDFAGAEFKLCYRLRAQADPDRSRATEFATFPGTARVYVRFRRAALPVAPGRYEGEHVHPGGGRAPAVVTLRPDGTYTRVLGATNRSEGRVEERDGKLFFRGAGGGGFVEEWTPDGDRVRVQLWYPASRYPNTAPVETGTLRRAGD